MVITNPRPPTEKSFENLVWLTLKQKSKVICWSWHQYISIFLVNKVCVPNMIYQTSLVVEKLTFHNFFHTGGKLVRGSWRLCTGILMGTSIQCDFKVSEPSFMPSKGRKRNWEFRDAKKCDSVNRGCQELIHLCWDKNQLNCTKIQYFGLVLIQHSTLASKNMPVKCVNVSFIYYEKWKKSYDLPLPLFAV